jgi:Predicted permeases
MVTRGADNIAMKQAYFKYLFVLFLFGSNGIIASYIPLNSYEIVFTRTLIGSVFIIAVILFSKRKLQLWKNRKHFGLLILSGFAMGASWMFLYEAYSQIGVGIATLAYYFGPVLVLVFSSLVYRERISFRKMLGCYAALLGMVFVNGTALLQSGLSQGLLFGILSAFMYALMVILNKKAASITGLENAMWQLCASFFIVALFTLAKQRGTISLTSQNILPILFLGVVNTGIGCYLYFSSIQQLNAQTVAILGYLEPLSALALSALILHEQLTHIQILGAVLILGGAVFGEVFQRRKFPKQS